MLIRFLTIIILMATCFFCEFAKGQESSDLMSMSLEELLDVQVVTASLESESLSRSAAIVSVITAQNLKELGVDSLAEALSFLPGVTLTESYFGYTTVNFRGVRQSHYNNKVLLLVNGHPSFERINGSFHLEHIPITAVERLEIIRGPGSALYGTNAFTGVINIITRQGEDKELAVDGNGGSDGRNELGFLWSRKTTLGDFNISGSWRDEEGYTYNDATDEPSGGGRLPIDLNYYNRNVSAFFDWTKGPWRFNSAIHRQAKAKLGLTPEIQWGGENVLKAYFADLNYQHTWTKLSFTGRLRYDRSERVFQIGHFPADAALGRDTDTRLESGSDLAALDLQLDYKFNEAWRLVTGINHEDSNADPYLFIFNSDDTISPFSSFEDSFKVRDTSLYSQLQYKKGKLSAIGGFRYDDNSDADKGVLVPRLGLVYQLAEDTFLKVLYGEAYRNPDFFEKHTATSGVLWGTPDLDRERIASLDVGLDMRIRSNYNLRLNAYSLKTEDLITRRAAIVNPNGAEYFNSAGEEIQGFELEGRRISERAGTSFINVSLIRAETADTQEELQGIANFTANFGWRGHAGQWAWLVSGQHVGPRDYNSNLDGAGQLDSYNLLNLGLDFTMGPWQMYARIKNALDESYHHPEYIRNNLARLPGGPDRSFYLGFRYNQK